MWGSASSSVLQTSLRSHTSLPAVASLIGLSQLVFILSRNQPGQFCSGVDEDWVLLPCHRAGAGGQEVTLHSHHPHGVMWVKIPQLHSPHHVPNLLEELELTSVHILCSYQTWRPGLRTRPVQAAWGWKRTQQHTCSAGTWSFQHSPEKISDESPTVDRSFGFCRSSTPHNLMSLSVPTNMWSPWEWQILI